MKVRIPVIAVCLLFLGAILAACGGGGSGGAAGTGTTNNPGSSTSIQVAPDMSNVPISMSFEERIAAVERVKGNWPTTGNQEADSAALLAYLRSQPDFADAGIGPDNSVWARYKDGLPVLFSMAHSTVAPQGVNSKATPVKPAGTDATRAGGSESPRAAEIPQGDTAVVINAFTDDGEDYAYEYAFELRWLNDAGYNIKNVLSGSLNDMIFGVTGAGVLHISSHAGYATDKSGKLGFGIRVRDSDLTSRDQQVMYLEGLLVLDVEKNDDGSYRSVWYFGEAFVRKFWTLKPDSLIIIDTCNLYGSGKQSVEAGLSFRQALQDKSGGRTTIVSWSGSVRDVFAYITTRLFLDRVFGKSEFNPVPTPPQRPFGYADVYEWMKSKGRITDPSNGATLTLEPRGTPDGQLVPSISKVNVLLAGPGTPAPPPPNEWCLELNGTFGPDPGSENRSVKVGATALEVYEGGWKEDSIRAKLPATMDAAYGDVVVEVRKHKSNIVPLTRWTGDIKQVQIDKSIGSAAKVEINCPIRATADVHFFRGKPDMELRSIVSTQLEITGNCSFAMSGHWGTANDYYDLSGAGSFAPLPLNQKNYGGLLGSSFATNVPPSFTATLAPVLVNGPALNPVKGTLTHTEISTNPPKTYVTTETVYGMWSASLEKYSWGLDYQVNGQSVNCLMFDGSCTQTLNLTPESGTIPTDKTPG